MRILHTSDWHLGMPLKLGTMIEDQQFFLDQLYSIIDEYDVDVVICAGDIYDSSVTNAEAIELYSGAITKICKELRKKMIVIAGNHDSGARLASGRELLELVGLYVSGKIVKDIKPVSLGNVDIYPVPFFNRDEVIALFPDKKNDITSQESATKVLCDHIKETMDQSRVNIIVSHAYITSAELSDSDRAAQVGQATSVSKDVFDGFDYVALGHIHKPQSITETIRYSGSPIKYSFGVEEAQVKQVLIYDTDSKEISSVELNMRHDRKSISGTYEEIRAMDTIEDCYLKVTVSDRIACLELLSELREKFPGILELYGMSYEGSGEETSITIDELTKLDETDIMMRFLEEQYHYTPNENQTNLYKAVVESIGEEADLG
jgi:exonuclease SbcD